MSKRYTPTQQKLAKLEKLIIEIWWATKSHHKYDKLNKLLLKAKCESWAFRPKDERD